MEKPYVSNKDESARMFGSDLLEVFTHVHPAIPHVIFIPVIGIMILMSFGISLVSAIFLFVFGIAIWTLTEYILHRFLFHIKPRNDWQQRFYFVIHGVHHDYPNDSRRLVMPPVVSIPLSVIFFGLFTLILGSHFVPPFFAGFISGYLVYDSIHYAIHHFRLRGKIGLYLRRRHLHHHFAQPNYNFGISSPFWDLVFGSLRDRPAERVKQSESQ
jgi:4-hydroxysphinganine ceramide fatty acyl 2-hydroxylase